MLHVELNRIQVAPESRSDVVIVRVYIDVARLVPCGLSLRVAFGAFECELRGEFPAARNRNICRTVWIPKVKAAILSTAAPIHSELGISQITIINTAADHYKHRVEWKEEDWIGTPPKNKTIASAAKLGLGPKGYHNMEHALRELKNYPHDMAPLGRIIGNWRESLADHLRAEGKKNGVDIHPRFPEDQDTDQEPAPQPIIVEDGAPF